MVMSWLLSGQETPARDSLPCRASCSSASASLDSEDLSTVPPYGRRASTALSGVARSTTRKRADVPGWSISRTCSWNCLLTPLLATLPISTPRPAPTAMPRKGMKNRIPNSSPQNIPQVAPAPIGLWLVVTWNLPSLSRLITAIASGSMMRSEASRCASSPAAVAVDSSGYPMATRVDISGALPFAGSVIVPTQLAATRVGGASSPLDENGWAGRPDIGDQQPKRHATRCPVQVYGAQGG